MSRERRPRRTLLWLMILAAIGVAVFLGGRDLFDGFVTRMRSKVRGESAPAAGTISGRVRFEDGTAARQAQVTVKFGGAEPKEVTRETAADGSFTLPRGDYGELVSLSAARGPLITRVDTVRFPSAEQLLTLPSRFELAGLVQAGEERAPVVGARVSIATLSTLTDEAGAFVLRDVPGAAAAELPVSLSVEAAGYRPLVHAVPADALPAVYGDLLLLLEPIR